MVGIFPDQFNSTKFDFVYMDLKSNIIFQRLQFINQLKRIHD
ncbi:hypothetical protein SAMN06265367_103171 [Algoriphagus winogradskyi]|uniref:Uncharacterized protein n=1 Tax=Algoriphagus winogradskyi TaxID=237017 RepID=A0ABY1NZ63_9BACT|nr:hypothetical protein SAMN06265367_103171 [Algoriphagus winogradskyi]